MNENERKEMIDRVEIRSPDGAVRIVPVHDARLVIGRAPQCEIHIDIDLLSRQHAELILDPFGRWWVRDLGSRNGMKVNGQRVTEKSVGPADVIRIGKCDIRLLPAARAPAGGVPAPEEAGRMQMQTLDEGNMPALTAAHLEGLLNLGVRLAAEGDAAARKRLLCELLMGKEFGGAAALIVRLGEAGARAQIVTPPPWESFTPGPGRSAIGHYHVSRTLLHAMRAMKKPVMGSNAAGAGVEEMMEISLDQVVMPAAGIACPLGDAEDLALYIAVSPEYARMEWLKLAALAAAQWRNAESAWREREHAVMHEAVERELKQARKIQRHYLPAAAAMKGCDWSLRMEPCQWVGGDYADIMLLPDGKIFAAVADVCGKGLHAALVGASLHTLMRTAIGHEVSLSRTMERADDYLRQFLPPGSFVTMAAILFDTNRREAEYYNAGHPSPFVLRGNDVRRLPEGEHYPLGVEHEDFTTAIIPLASDETIILYTDGCTDVINPAGERLSEEQLTRFVADIARRADGLTPATLVDGMFEKLESHRGQCMPPDDRTIVACRFQ